MINVFSLNLDKNGQILSSTFSAFAPNGVLVPSLPDGDIADYKYINGEFVLEPLPKPEPPAPTQTTDERLKTLESKNGALTTSNQFLEDCIAEMAGIVYA